MLVLAHADGLGIDLHQLRQGVLEPPGNGHRRAQIYVVLRELLEQCAGFLRVPESGAVLDNTAVHPESYQAAGKLLERTGHTMEDVAGRRLGDLEAQIRALGAEELAAACGVGVRRR